MSKTILAISGSPRPKGNTESLLKALIDEALKAGKTVVNYRAADLKVGPCHGCCYCLKHNAVCVQKDDMPQILDNLRNCEAIVLASPVYYYGLSAQIKLVIDRFFALIEEGMAIKRAALLMTCGDDATAANPSIANFRAMANYLKWEEAGVVVAPNLHDPGEIEGRPELEEAKRLGAII
ncbi:MAG: flavodoxin family protein [Deltaproteobacteria bacterium]|jgi:multimeric flavodoxin WrbA|nr:flavodoxin family protein [Deltaproteobacteria bacterium]